MSSCDFFFCMNLFVDLRGVGGNIHLTFFCVNTASTQPQPTARNRIVLHQKDIKLSGCNIRSYIHFKAWGFVSHVKKMKLRVDEIFAFVVPVK